MNRLLGLCSALLLLAPLVRAADSPGVAIRTGNHPGFGRIVFDTPAGTRYQMSRNGDAVVIQFTDGTILRPPPSPPANVKALRSVAGRVEIVLVANASPRESRIDGRVVIDVLDPVGVKPPPVKSPEPTPSLVLNPPVVGPPVVEPPTPTAATMPAGPVALAATPLLPPEGVAFTVPLGPQAGAALFRRGTTVYVVFDERRPIDLAALRGNLAFGSAMVRELPKGTLITFDPPTNAGVVLSPTANGWKIAILPEVKPARAIPYVPKDGQVPLPAEAPGSVISMADPDTGATLLVGTLRRPGQALSVPRQTAEFALLPALLGVVVEPLADNVTLRTLPTGFLLSGGAGGLAVTTPSAGTDAAAAAVHLTRRFRLPAQSNDVLVQRLSRGITEAAETPPRARGPKRRAVASTMLSLGLGVEAQALLLVAAEQDPKEAALPETMGLTAIASLLAGRAAAAGGINDPRLTGTDEIALWRAIRQALTEDAPAAAATFAATGSLALLYPPGIRDRILPLMAETMILDGEPAAAKRLLAMASDVPGLSFARALLQQTDGDAVGALSALDTLANGHDQRDHARAAARAVELRLAGGQLDAAQAAEALDKLRYAWRGDRRELALRERVADLRQRAGAWRSALAELRSAEADFPDYAQTIHTHLTGMFITLLYSEATDALSPLDLVSLVDENADLFKALPDNEEMRARLADRLLALDLPSRATALLEKLMVSARMPTMRAVFSYRLADLRLREGDAAGSIAALGASAGVDLDPGLAEQRAILGSVAQARLGNPQAAIDALAGLTGARAQTARAAVYEQGGDWHAAKETLMLALGATLPPSGELTEPQRHLVLRLVTAAERAGDHNTLAALRTTLESRLGSGPVADMIRLLTAEPVRATADLARANRELDLAKAIPAAVLKGR